MAVGIVFAIVGCGGPETRPVTSPVLLRLTLSKGDRYEATEEAQSTTVGLDAHVYPFTYSSTTEYVVKSVTGDKITLETKMTTWKSNPPVESFSLDVGKVIEEVRDSRNRTISFGGLALAKTAIGETSSMLFPEQPVRSGDTWRVGSGAASVEFRFEGLRRFGGRDAYYITAKQVAGVTNSATTEIFLDKASCWILSSSGNMRATTGGAPRTGTYRSTGRKL